MPSESAAEMKVTWNYVHPDDSIEVWIGDERIARFAGTAEAMDHLALALLDLRTQPEIVKRLPPEKMTEGEMMQEVHELKGEIGVRQRRIQDLLFAKQRREVEFP